MPANVSKGTGGAPPPSDSSGAPYGRNVRLADLLTQHAVRRDLWRRGGLLQSTPFLVVDGVCAGIWSRKKRARTIELTVEPARRLTRAERAGIDAEAERIGHFLGLEPVLAIGAKAS